MELRKLGEKLEQRLIELNAEVEGSGGVLNAHVRLEVCGQISLLADEFLSSKIELEGTRDLDAFREVSMQVEDLVDEVIREFELVYDKLSSEIWMPSETEWDEVYKGEFVELLKAKPIFVLASKAIKSPEKNKKLLKDSIEVYGKELEDLVIKYGGNLNDFK